MLKTKILFISAIILVANHINASNKFADCNSALAWARRKFVMPVHCEQMYNQCMQQKKCHTFKHGGKEYYACTQPCSTDQSDCLHKEYLAYLAAAYEVCEQDQTTIKSDR